MVRLLPQQANRLDKWRHSLVGNPGRPEAIRRLIEQALASKAPGRPPHKENAGKASKLATRELEGLGDKGLPAEEQDRRKRVLVKGPKEFRDVRGDQPKKNESR
jgi:hypothetical protein